MDGRVKDLLRKSCSAGAPWEVAVQVVSSLFQSKNGSHHDVCLIYAVVGECMRLCIMHQKTADALRIYELFSRSGYVLGQSRHARLRSLPVLLSVESLRGLSADELALVALRQHPHRVHQSRIVAQMIAAEDADPDDVRNTPVMTERPLASKAPPFRDGVQTFVNMDGGFAETFNVPFLGVTEVTEAEQFRILLQQNMQLLRETRYFQQRLGLHYLLSQMRHVVDNKRLSSEVEMVPLVHVGRAVLEHPFIFAKPSTETARQQLLFEEFGSLPVHKGLSEVQQAKLMALETTVEPLRPLCREPLKFMDSLASSWDALFVRRAALTLVLPREAHDVLPRSRTRGRGGGSINVSGGGGDCGRGERHLENSLTASTWTDASSELFGGVEVRDAASRVELLINRRLHHNIVVPDTTFLLQNTNQLLQLARHREVVIPHSVFLDLVNSASDDQGRRRFHSRRVLLLLMHATTTKKTVRDTHGSLDSYSVHMKRSQGGVTLLGLQDEVVLLENSHERFFLADALAGQEQEGPSIGRSSLASVLVAKQLGKMVSSTPGYVTCRDASTNASEVDHLVAGVIASMKDESETQGDHGALVCIRGKPAPLFKSRSRSFWARTPVVLATTSDVTRRVAFMVGLPMFPPVSAV
ncbi:hypothetical protein C3747_1g39 [Trypanosoma cruzi]|uniref:PIN domain-containing protein n=1 Tax=Trypanosoma cruzi TaxID=5693 RepID=A0A2V2XM11_TRYCR|nr:hypothetical protein C3747_1g39 [Trypanosoma cruzi]RNC50025.1 hypothetical protein TcCL_NonESM00352 [Trypanosoma cruzi]